MYALFRRFGAILCVLLALGCATARAEAEPLNLLLIGVDSGDGGRGRSDTMMLAHIDPGSRSIRLVSFLRDLYVPISGVGSTRLNAAYFYGGEELLKQTLKEQFGVEIDRTATIHFSMLADLVDQLGGIEIDIQPREISHLNDIIADYNADYGLSGGWIREAGLQRLDGRQALCYSRIRKIDSDFQRASRQQAVISAMLSRLSQLEPWKLMGLALRNLGRVETDVTFQDVARLVPLLGSIGELDLASAQVPFEGAYSDETVNGMMVLKPHLEQNQQKLKAFLAGES